MPNGGDRNFVRFCGAIDGFKERHGHWPQRVVVKREYIDGLRDHLLAPGQFERLLEKLDLVEGDARFRAEDDAGHSYDYSQEGFPRERPRPSAEEWLDVRLNPDLG